MSSDAVETEQRLADLAAASATSSIAQVETVDWVNEVVTVVYGDGSRQTLSWALSAPWPDDVVRIVSVGHRPFCIPVHGPTIGVVESVASGKARVRLDNDRTVTWPYVGAAPSSGQRVFVDPAGRIVVGVYSSEPPGSDHQVAAPLPPAAPPTGGPTFHLLRFVPIGTANYRNGAYAGSALEISSNRSAFIFYGTQVRDSIPGDASNIGAELVLGAENWDNVPGVASLLGTHAWAGGPPGSPPGINTAGALSVWDGGKYNVGGFMPSFRDGSAFGFAFPAGDHGWRQFSQLADLYVSFYA